MNMYLQATITMYMLQCIFGCFQGSPQYFSNLSGNLDPSFGSLAYKHAELKWGPWNAFYLVFIFGFESPTVQSGGILHGVINLDDCCEFDLKFPPKKKLINK